MAQPARQLSWDEVREHPATPGAQRFLFAVPPAAEPVVRPPLRAHWEYDAKRACLVQLWGHAP